MTEYLVDTAVFAYALGGPHTQRGAGREVVAHATSGEIRLHASVEMVQELLHHRMRRTDRQTALAQTREASELCTLHAFGPSVLTRALNLVGSTTLRGRDAVHAATAIENGIVSILSPDTDFDGIPGLIRVSPESVH